MQRGKIVFEHYSLVTGQNSDMPGNGNDYYVDERNYAPSMIGKSNFRDNEFENTRNRNSGESDQSEIYRKPSGVVTEGVLRKNLRKMCTRPQRKVINFMDQESGDMSLYSML